MSRISVSLNESNSQWVADQAGADVEAYVNEALAKDRQRREAEAELRDMLDRAEASGISTRTPQQIIADVKAKLKANGKL